MRLGNLGEGILHRSGAGDIAGHGQRTLTDSRGDVLNLGQRAAEQHDLLALTRETLRKGATEPAVGPRDDNNLARHIHLPKHYYAIMGSLPDVGATGEGLLGRTPSIAVTNFVPGATRSSVSRSKAAQQWAFALTFG